MIGYFGVCPGHHAAENRLRMRSRMRLIRAEEEKNKSEAIIAAIGDGISIQDREFRVAVPEYLPSAQ